MGGEQPNAELPKRRSHVLQQADRAETDRDTLLQPDTDTNLILVVQFVNLARRQRNKLIKAELKG